MCNWGIVWVISSLCSWEFTLSPFQVWKDPPLGFHPISFWYHEQGWFTSWSPIPPFPSLILLFFVQIQKSPQKIAQIFFLQFVGSCEIWLFWSTNLEFGKWIYPSSCFPTFQTLEIALPWKIPMDPDPFIRSQHTPCTRTIQELSAIFCLHHIASIPTLVFFRTISRGCLSFGPRFLLCVSAT